MELLIRVTIPESSAMRVLTVVAMCSPLASLFPDFTLPSSESKAFRVLEFIGIDLRG
jgi:hypothetical protein